MARLLLSVAALALVLLVPAAAAAGPTAPPASGRVLRNGWYYDEVGNGCMAARDAGHSRLMIRLTRWNDLSDSLLFHQPGLPPLWSEEGLPSGLTEQEEEAEGEAGYHLEVRIDGKPVEQVLAMNSMLLDLNNRPGPTYRFGIRQQPFIKALRTGRVLEVFRHGRRLAAFPIAGSRAMAQSMSSCVDLPLAR